MQYTEFSKKNKSDPFLHPEKDTIIEQTDHMFVLPNRAPYADDHLLIVPKRSVHLFKSLSKKEQEEMWHLIEKRTYKLHTKHKHVAVLLKD